MGTGWGWEEERESDGLEDATRRDETRRSWGMISRVHLVHLYLARHLGGLVDAAR
jgi:hypothetical protein